MKEEWRKIPGANGWYEVSNKGRVRSWNKCGYSTARAENSKVLKLHSGGTSDHRFIYLYLNKERKHCLVHRLVALAFLGKPQDPNKIYVCHKDDDPTNNVLSNLYWGTPKQNQRDRLKNIGHQNEGENHGMSFLSKKQVERIYSVYKRGEVTQQELADKYGTSRSTISNIINGKTWASVTSNIST